MQPTTLSHENVPEWFQNGRMTRQAHHPQTGHGYNAGTDRNHVGAHASGSYHHTGNDSRQSQSRYVKGEPQPDAYGTKRPQRNHAPALPTHRQNQLPRGHEKVPDTSLAGPRKPHGGTSDGVNRGSVYHGHGRVDSRADPSSSDPSTNGPASRESSTVASTQTTSAPPVEEEKKLSKSAKAKLRKKKREGRI